MKQLFIALFFALLSTNALSETLECPLDDENVSVYAGGSYLWAKLPTGRMYNGQLRLTEGVAYFDDGTIQQFPSFDYSANYLLLDGEIVGMYCYESFGISIEFNRMFISFIFDGVSVNLEYRLIKRNSWRQ